MGVSSSGPSHDNESEWWSRVDTFNEIIDGASERDTNAKYKNTLENKTNTTLE